MNRKTKQLNRKNNELDDKLKKEDAAIMTDIVCYFRGSSMSEWRVKPEEKL